MNIAVQPRCETSNEVVLSESEMHMATAVGCRRQIQALQAGLTPNAGYKGSGWEIHIEGAAGELAFARFRNLYWPATVGTFKRGGDIGDNIQVRTRTNWNHDLIVRDTDRNDDVFILVVGTIPRFHIVGWLRGGDAKHPRYRKTYGDRPAAYFIPQHDLRPFEKTQP